VNLDSGTHLINFDLPWSAGALKQRVARIDRTSSKHERIDILYLYTSGTIEERQYHMLAEKDRIAEAFIDGKGYPSGDGGVLQLELSSLREFLEGR
jgi:SNF2 family DNA or RNA helicase